MQLELEYCNWDSESHMFVDTPTNIINENTVVSIIIVLGLNP